MPDWTSVFDLYLVYAALIALFSAVLHGYTGFGGALFMMPLYTLLYGPVEALCVASVVGLAASLQLYPGAMRAAPWRPLLPLFAGVALATPVGIALLITLDALIIRRAVGVIILLAAIILLSGWSYRGPRTVATAAAVGGITGLVNGSVGIGGPPLILYFLSAADPPAVQRGNIVLSVGVVILLALAALIVAGGFSGATVVRSAVLTPFYILGAWAGARLFAVAPKAYFRKVALVLLIATGVLVLVA